jgi:hypothetical protein
VAKVRANTRTMLFSMENEYYFYLFSGVLNKGVTPGLASFWASCVPQEILGHNLSEGRKHLDNVGPLKLQHIARLQNARVDIEIDMQLKYTKDNPL